MTDLMKYAMVFEKALSEDFCKNLISEFEQHEETKIERDESWEHGTRNFVELNLCEHYDDFVPYVDEIYNVMERAYKKYLEVNSLEFMPSEFGFEAARMKRYDQGKGEFGWHTDVNDYSSARRFLVCLFYLNTVEKGGQTEFLLGQLGEKQTISINPAAGSILLFPPMWMYPHRGSIPESGPKYIISTYYHYI